MAWRNLGIAEYRLGHGEAARHAFERVLLLRPGDPDVMPRLVGLLVRAGHYDRALELAGDMGAEQTPASLGAKVAWARDARDLLARVDAERPDGAELARLASEQAGKDRHHLATTLFVRAFEADPRTAQAHALVAALSAVSGAELADSQEGLAFHEHATRWLRLRLQALRDGDGESTRAEIRSWQEKLPLRDPENASAPEAARETWRRLAAEVGTLLEGTENR